MDDVFHGGVLHPVSICSVQVARIDCSVHANTNTSGSDDSNRPTITDHRSNDIIYNH